MPVKFADVLEGYEMTSMTSGDSHAWLCRQTGEVHSRLDPDEVGEEYAGDLPDDIDDEEKYVELPDKRELDLGTPLVMEFVRQVLPDDLGDVRDMFHRRGAYAMFKRLLLERGALDQWYDFERAATERALREWCALNEIELVD
jgi:hypothetical protein